MKYQKLRFALPIDIGDEDTRSPGASLPMIGLGARANSSGWLGEI
jgi:hypothetical protein